MQIEMMRGGVGVNREWETTQFRLPRRWEGQQLAIATEYLKKKYEHKTQTQNTEQIT